MGLDFFWCADVLVAGQGLWNDSWGDKVLWWSGNYNLEKRMVSASIPGAGRMLTGINKNLLSRDCKAKADQYGVDLKYIVSVWSPPADMKWLCQFLIGQAMPVPHGMPVRLLPKNGGTLNPDKYMEILRLLKSCIQSLQGCRNWSL